MTHYLDVAQNHGSPLIIESIADQVANAAPLYLDGSQVAVPQSNLGERTSIEWYLALSKTAVGIGAPTINVRVGKTGTIADPVRLAFPLPAQTAAVDAGIIEVNVQIRVGGKNAILFGSVDLDHNGPGAVGLSTVVSPIVHALSAAFDLTGDDNVIALSVDPGDAVWTIRTVQTEVELT